MKYTPGPWKVEDGISHTFIKHKDFYVCELERIGWDDETTDANAKLIAAAPEMLEALQFVVEHHDIKITTALKELIEKLLKKATE